MKLIECIPNISEGRDLDRIKEFASILKTNPSAQLFHYHWDKNHNRSVFTVVGKPEAVIDVTLKACLQALEWVDMRKHKGEHPRIGAVDVVPFAPISKMTMEEAVEWARKFGTQLGEKAQIPIYFYEEAAFSPSRKNLAEIRKGEYEGLAKKLEMQEWKPDAGVPYFNPRSGATIVGARFPVIAFNVNLNTNNSDIAWRIAKSVRHINGGFRFVKAIGVNLSDQGLTQVSMNLTDYRKTSIHCVFETIKLEASRYGINVVGSEIVGMLPLQAMEEVLRFYLRMESFSIEQVIEQQVLKMIDWTDNGPKKTPAD